MQTVQELGAGGVIPCEPLLLLFHGRREGFYILLSAKSSDAETRRVDSRPQILERWSEVPLYHWFNPSEVV